MEALVLDGKNFVKASKAAKELGYASDYVGHLCRSGQVEAHLIGRTWYVDQAQLGTHRVEKKRMSRVKAREHAKKSIEEHRLKIREEQDSGKDKKIRIQYESDEEELIPETRKISVQSLIPAENTHRKNAIDDFSNETEIENEGNKVIMSGDLTVVDVTDEAQDPDTVLLTPTHIRGTVHPIKGKYSTKAEKNLKESPELADGTIVSIRTPSFEERLTQNEVIDAINPVKGANPTTSPEIPVDMQVGNVTQEKSSSIIGISSLILLLTIVTFLTIPTTLIITYSTATNPRIEESLSFSKEEAVEIILFKI